MRVELLKSWKNMQGRKYPIGTILQVDESLGRKLINSETGKDYDGIYPPVQKVKTELFKPKKTKK